jgi:hypothetical protein
MTESLLPKNSYSQTHGLAFGGILDDLHVFKTLGGQFDTFTPRTESVGTHYNCLAYVLNIKEVNGDSVLNPGDFLDLKPVDGNAQHAKSFPEWCENDFDDKFKWDGFKRTLSAGDVAIQKKLEQSFSADQLEHLINFKIQKFIDLESYKKETGLLEKDIAYLKSISYNTHLNSLQDLQKAPDIIANVIGESTPTLLLRKQGYYMCLKAHPNAQTDVGFDFSTVLGCDDNPWACTGGKVQKLSFSDVQLLATKNSPSIYKPELLYAPQRYRDSVILKTEALDGGVGDYALAITSPTSLFSDEQMQAHELRKNKTAMLSYFIARTLLPNPKI